MLLDWILAATPLLVILILMLGFRWGASKAGPAGWFTAIIVAAVHFGTGIEVLALAQTKAVFLALDVLLITWSAFLLYRVTAEAGAISTISSAVTQLTPDRVVQALLIGWAFASFLQGVGGFGVPTAVTAPLLIGLGFTPLSAIVIPSIGHAWSVSFGSLAISIQALIATTGIPGEILVPAAAALLGIIGFFCGFMVAHLVGGWRAIKIHLLPILLIGLAMSSTQYILATNGLWNLAGLGAGLMGLVAGYILARRSGNQAGRRQEFSVSRRDVLLAFSGYIALVVFTLIIFFFQPLRSFLDQFVIRLSFPEMGTSHGFIIPAGYGREIPLFRHAGAILFYSSLFTYLLYRLKGLLGKGSAPKILGGTIQRVLPSSLGIVAMIAMAMVMLHAGMTETLALGLARGAGDFYPLIAPWIGALGAFMTGSNTNSNVLFGTLQMRTAELLGYAVTVILAAQTGGGAVGSVLAPTKIVVGASTTELIGQEGHIMKKLIGYVAILLMVMSAITWLLT
jgi:lactate permease